MSKLPNTKRTTATGMIKLPPTTRQFLKKFCYRETASIDMTQFGFITDSKVTPVNLLLKPLRKKLEDIFDPSESDEQNKPNKKRRRRSVTHFKSPIRKSKVTPIPPRPTPDSSLTTKPEKPRKSRVTFNEGVTIMNESPTNTNVPTTLKFKKW